MAIRFDIPLGSALVLAMVMAVVPAGVRGGARDCASREAGVDALSPAGFAVQMSLLDFLVIQRALMTMQDERAAPALQRLRLQLSGQAERTQEPDR
jgi:hypothetical protein